MKKGYYTDSEGRCLGGWELDEKPSDTAEYKWFESDIVPSIYQPRTEAVILAEIKHLEEGYNYSMMDGEIEWANQKKAQRLLLKQELRSLNASS